MAVADGAQDEQGTPAAGIANLFDRVADTYDAVGVDWFVPIAAGLVEALSPQPGERALDVGCGKGAATVALAVAVGPRGAVTGIDLAPRMVEAARAATAGLAQVEVHVADATAPGLPPGAYDVLASSLVLFFLPDPSAVLRTWAALLRPGGRLGVATFGAQDALWDRIDAVFTPYLPTRLLDARTSGRRGPFANDTGVEGLFVDAGLTDVTTRSVRVVAELRDADHWYAFSRSHGQRAMWDCVPTREQDRVRAEAYELIASGARPDGSLGLGQTVRYTLGRRP